jgi:sec-independent protein translocase protein TatA
MFEGLSPSHVLIVAVIALLLFGDRLPQVMRSVGRSVMEFKKGMRGIESAIEAAASAPATSPEANQSRLAQKESVSRETISAPRFDPPTTEPHVIDVPVQAVAPANEPAPPV